MNTNRKECLISSGILLIEFFKVCMACFLSLFVPQQCDNNMCAMTQLLQFDDTYRLIVFLWNCATFAVCVYSYRIEYLREFFIINNFNTDDNVADQALVKSSPHKVIFNKLSSHNRRFYYVTIGVFGMMSINMILSGVLFALYFNGTQTITSAISYLLLISVMIYENYSVSKQSINKNMALSSILKEPISYNVIELH